MKHTLSNARPHALSAAILGVCATLLAACGGGGSNDPATSGGTASVASASAGVPKYGQSLTLSLTGSNLDQGLTVSASGCSGVVRVPAQSSAASAVYQCTVSAVGAGSFTVARTADGAGLATAAFSVPTPQVTLTIGNGAAVGGTIVMTLAPDKAPVTVDNFLAHVNAGFYAGTVFDRVSPGFVVQGGGYTSPLDATHQNLKPNEAAIELEVGKGLSNTQWTVAMAISPDGKKSAPSEFFINLADNSGALDPGITSGFAVFGSVTSATTGSVSAIAGAPCVALPLFLADGDCTPTPNVVIVSAVQTQ